MFEHAEGEGLEDGGARTPTRDTTEFRPLAHTAALLSVATVGNSVLLSIGSRAALRRSGTRSPRRRPHPRPARLHPGPRPGAPVHGHIGFIAPVTASARGPRQRRRHTRSRGSVPAPSGTRSRTRPRGNPEGRQGKLQRPKARHPHLSGPRRPPSPTTHPRALTPRKSPGGQRRPQPSCPRRRRREGGRRSGARRRPQGSRRGGGGQEGRREDGAKSLLEHRLLLLLFFLLPIHDGQDDFPLLLGEVAEVGHLRLQRPLRGRRSGSRAAPRPDRSRHV